MSGIKKIIKRLILGYKADASDYLAFLKRGGQK